MVLPAYELLPQCKDDAIRNKISRPRSLLPPGINVALFSPPVSRELPFCETILLRKQLISPILFGLSKSGKRTLFYIVLTIERYINRKVSFKAGFVNYFSKLFVDFRKVDLPPKLLEKILVFFRYIFS